MFFPRILFIGHIKFPAGSSRFFSPSNNETAFFFFITYTRWQWNKLSYRNLRCPILREYYKFPAGVVSYISSFFSTLQAAPWLFTKGLSSLIINPLFIVVLLKKEYVNDRARLHIFIRVVYAVCTYIWFLMVRAGRGRDSCWGLHTASVKDSRLRALYNVCRLHNVETASTDSISDSNTLNYCQFLLSMY